jgi:ABC-2 type transport system permease protein
MKSGYARVVSGERALPEQASLLLFFMLTQYNAWTLTGVLEEKSSRVVEVLLAAVTPARLLAGKVAGIGLTAFAQAGLAVVTAIALARATHSDALAGITPEDVASTLTWLVLGYAFYSWVYAAAGSTADRAIAVYRHRGLPRVHPAGRTPGPLA